MKTLLGPSKSLEILLSCRTLQSEDALSIGLCDKVISDENCLQETKNWLETLIQHDSIVLESLKKSIYMEQNSSFENERKLFAPLWGGSSNKKALSQNLKH